MFGVSHCNELTPQLITATGSKQQGACFLVLSAQLPGENERKEHILPKELNTDIHRYSRGGMDQIDPPATTCFESGRSTPLVTIARHWDGENR